MVDSGRNASLLEKCFFTERFTPELVNLLNDCGIKLGVNHATLKLFGKISSCIGFRATFPPLIAQKPNFEAWKGILVYFKGIVCFQS